MSGAIGAALKKIATMILTDRRVLKKVGMAVLVVIVAVFMPVTAVMGVFSGEVQIDIATLRRTVVENLSVEEISMLSAVENTMEAIETAMTEAGFPSKVKEAQVLYIMALYDCSNQPGFVVRLISCFRAEQTDAQLVDRVNAAFGTDILAENFTDVMDSIRTTDINDAYFENPAHKNNLDLVAWAKAAEDANWGYVWGTFGRVLTEGLLQSKLEQYPQDIGQFEDFIRANWLGGRTADCIGLIKGYSWYDPETGDIGYAVNGMPDVGANQMNDLAVEKGSIDTIPEIPGLLVWMDGHIGIYIGDGQVIEAMGTLYGVVQTELSNRGWVTWMKNPYIDYIEEREPIEHPELPEPTMVPWEYAKEVTIVDG